MYTSLVFRKTFLPIFLVTTSFPILFMVRSSSGFECVECHSKRPATLAMHEAVRGRNCFDCHVRGEKLRQKGGIPKEKHDAFLDQRLTDPRCVECHEKKDLAPAKKNATKSETPPTLSGRTFCPACQVTRDKGRSTCQTCGGELLNMDRLMREAALNPKEELCRQCHSSQQALRQAHPENKVDGFEMKMDCLECHEAHSDCGGCHK